MDSSTMQSNNNQNSSKGRMDFEHFLKFLEIIAEKVFPAIPLSQAFTYLISDFLLPLLDDSWLAEGRCV